MAVLAMNVGQQDRFEIGHQKPSVPRERKHAPGRAWPLRGLRVRPAPRENDRPPPHPNCPAGDRWPACTEPARRPPDIRRTPRSSGHRRSFLPAAMPAFWHRRRKTSSPPRRGATDRATDPGAGGPVRLVLLEETVEGERVLHLRRVELQQLGDFHHRLQRHVPQPPMNDVQRRQRHGLSRWIAREIRLGSRRPSRRSGCEVMRRTWRP